MTPNEAAMGVVLFILCFIIACLIIAILIMRSDTSTPQEVINARDDALENITRELQQGMVSQATANEGFRKQLRENFVENEDQKTIIVDLRAMIVTKNQNIELKAGQLGLQSGLLIVSAHEIETLKKFNDLQESRIRDLEARLAATLNDGYGEKPASLDRDNMQAIE